MFNLTSGKTRQDKAIKVLHDFTRTVIKKRRLELIEKNITDNVESVDDNDIGTKKKMALLDVLLQSTIEGKPLTDEEIQEEVDTFMFEVS